MLADSAQARTDRFPPMLRLPGRGGNSVGQKFFLEHPRRINLIAGRVGRVDLDVPGEQVGRLLGDLVPIDRLGRRRLDTPIDSDGRMLGVADGAANAEPDRATQASIHAAATAHRRPPSLN